MARKLDKATVEEEFSSLMPRCKIVSIKHERVVYKSSGRKQKVWRIYFKCIKNRNNVITLSNLRRIKGRGRSYQSKLSIDEHIRRLSEAHDGFFNYEIFKRTGYTRSKDKITIICPVHGEFKQEYTAHASGKNGCPGCRKNLPIKGAQLAEDVISYSKGTLSPVGIRADKKYLSTEYVEVSCNLFNWHPTQKRKIGKVRNRKSVSCKFCKTSGSSRYVIEAIFLLQ